MGLKAKYVLAFLVCILTSQAQTANAPAPQIGYKSAADAERIWA